MSGEEFSLDALIEKVRSEVGPDPSDIAAKVQGQIPRRHRDAVELKLLVNYVRVSKARLSQVINRHSAPATNSAPTRKANRSAKVAGYQLLARTLAVQVCVGPSLYKTLGDCSYEDLIFAASNRRQHAAMTIAAADDYEAFAALVKKHKTSTVAAIPRDVLSAFVESRKAAA